jgi:3-oxoacyl-[acyl-carrier protein] reductase
MKTKNRVAIVTGGGIRLGRKIVLALGSSGYDVVVNYNKSKAGAAKTVKDLQKLTSKAISIKADISNKKEVAVLVRETIKTFGRVDLLINNAAVFFNSSLKDTTEQKWDKTLNTNLKGSFLISQAVAPYMLKRKNGCIINIASIGGIQAWTNFLPYCVSKAGVIMLTRCLAKTLAPHIRVNAIAPGIINIDGEENSKVKHILKKNILLKRYGTPSDITDIVLFIAKKSKYITGQVFVVDGGKSV